MPPQTQTSKPNIIQQGAEAIILHEGRCVIKDRISKGYRHPQLDKKIIKQRTKSEAKLLEKASKLIPVPVPELVEFNEIKMPFINGKKLSENLEQLDYKAICKIIGNQIAKLHDNNIIRGDLTTSNMIWVERGDAIILKSKDVKTNQQDAPSKSAKQSLTINKSQNPDAINDIVKDSRSDRASAGHGEAIKNIQPTSINFGYPHLFFIDFGLGYISNRIEDKAVDLHLIKQALEAKHFSIHKDAEKIILENYNSKDKEKILEQLKKVESRGRYKH